MREREDVEKGACNIWHRKTVLEQQRIHGEDADDGHPKADERLLRYQKGQGDRHEQDALLVHWDDTSKTTNQIVK